MSTIGTCRVQIIFSQRRTANVSGDEQKAQQGSHLLRRETASHARWRIIGVSNSRSAHETTHCMPSNER